MGKAILEMSKDLKESGEVINKDISESDSLIKETETLKPKNGYIEYEKKEIYMNSGYFEVANYTVEDKRIETTNLILDPNDEIISGAIKYRKQDENNTMKKNNEINFIYNEEMKKYLIEMVFTEDDKKHKGRLLAVANSENLNVRTLEAISYGNQGLLNDILVKQIQSGKFELREIEASEVYDKDRLHELYKRDIVVPEQEA